MQQFHVAHTRYFPAIQIDATRFDVWASDTSEPGNRRSKANEGFRDAIWVGLVDPRVWARLVAVALTDLIRPSLSVEKPRGPRELVAIHRREREHLSEAVVKA